MNITKESEDYFKSLDDERYQEGIDLCDKLLNIPYSGGHCNTAIHDTKRYIMGSDPSTSDLSNSGKYYYEYLLENIEKDKLRLTPDSNIKRVKFNFRVNWSKIFKRGWLLWK